MNSAEIVEKLRGIARYGYHSQPCRCQHCADNRQFLEGAIAALAAADAHAQEQARELEKWKELHDRLARINTENAKRVLDRDDLVRTLQAERDEAIAHDRQPYPTAAAYELVCAARDKWQARAEAAESTQARLREALDKYGRHTACRMGKCVRCGIGPLWHGNVLGQDHAIEPSPCTCGFSAALTPAADQDTP